ncbi:MAG: hypothetical protein ACN6PN_20725 [Sphingobacterium sp.]
MKKYLALFCSSLFALAAPAQEKKSKFTIIPVIGWNQEKLDWNIAGDENGQNPNILSELKWRKLRGPEIGISSTIALSSALQAEVAFRHFWISQGTVNDADYASDNRAVKTADYDFKANRGHSSNIRVEIFNTIRTTEKLAFTAHTGYFGRYQTLYMLDGAQPLVESKELKSTYKPRWHGLILGLKTDYHTDHWSLLLDVSGIYFPRYSANANWNLQEDFNHPISFTHKAKGMGWEVNFRLERQVTKSISPFVQIGYTGLSTRTGTDQLFKADGTSTISQLNAVHSSSLRLGLGVHMKF